MCVSDTRVFPAKFSSLSEIGRFASQSAADAGLSDRAVYAVEMAVDEACSNIIEHAYLGGEYGEIECTFCTSPHRLTVVLRDHGAPFDPTLVSEPDLSAKLHNRSRGGLGIYFVRKLMDRVEYRYEPGKGNVLTLTKYRERTS